MLIDNRPRFDIGRYQYRWRSNPQPIEPKVHLTFGMPPIRRYRAWWWHVIIATPVLIIGKDK